MYKNVGNEQRNVSPSAATPESQQGQQKKDEISSHVSAGVSSQKVSEATLSSVPSAGTPESESTSSGPGQQTAKASEFYSGTTEDEERQPPHVTDDASAVWAQQARERTNAFGSLEPRERTNAFGSLEPRERTKAIGSPEPRERTKAIGSREPYADAIDQPRRPGNVAADQARTSRSRYDPERTLDSFMAEVDLSDKIIKQLTDEIEVIDANNNLTAQQKTEEKLKVHSRIESTLEENSYRLTLDEQNKVREKIDFYKMMDDVLRPHLK